MMLRPALLALSVLALPAIAQAADPAPAPRRRIVSIAPGNPATVGQNGALTGVVPGQSVPAPHGAMSTFGGRFGTEGPRAPGAAAAPAAR